MARQLLVVCDAEVGASEFRPSAGAGGAPHGVSQAATSAAHLRPCDARAAARPGFAITAESIFYLKTVRPTWATPRSARSAPGTEE